MRRFLVPALIAVLILTAGIFLKASITQPSIGGWLSAGSMTAARNSAASALLQDGRILITGGDNGSGPIASAEVFDSTGSFVAAPPMGTARSAHSATVLVDGRVLVAGGSTGAAATNAAEIFDPAKNAWTPVAGGMIQARSNHTASLLADGRVLFAGGDNAGAPTACLEIFDPVTNSFSSAGTTTSLRTSFASAVLSDGRVILIGGSDGTAPLASTEIFDPTTNLVAAGPALSAPRMAHSATTLIDGRVLVVGGTTVITNPDGSTAPTDLGSAEIYDPATGSFSVSASSLAAPRRDHAAFLLPNNASVLIVGGTSAGNEVGTAEMFVPSTGAFAATGSPSVARRHATGAPLSLDGVFFFAGGSNSTGALSSAELYGFATVKTDAKDYAPGSIVTITGSGWKPGETVTLTLVESPLFDTHPVLTSVADAQGNIFNNQFSPDLHDVGIRFYLTATGSQSQAQTTFTDNLKIAVSRDTPAAASISEVTGSNFTVTFAIKNANNGGNNSSNISGNWTLTESGNITTADATSGSFTNLASSSPTGVLLTFHFTAPATAETGDTITLTSNMTTPSCTPGGGNVCTDNATYTVGIFAPPTISKSFSPSSITVGGTSTLTFTLSNANATTLTSAAFSDPLPAGVQVAASPSASNTCGSTFAPTAGATTITFTGGTIAANASCILSVNVTATTAGSKNNTTNAVTATATGGFGLTGNTASSTLTVTATVPTTMVLNSVSPNSVAFGSSGPVTFTATLTRNDTSAGVVGATVNFTVDGAAVGSAVTGTGGVATFTTYNPSTLSVTTHNVASSFSAATISGTQFGASTSGTLLLTVSKATPMITWANPADITYGTPLSATQLNATASVPGNFVYAPATGTVLNSGTGQTLHVNFTPTDTTSYSTVSKDVTINVNRRDATWTTNPAGKTYGDSDPAPLTTGSGTNFVAADGVTATYSRVPGETVLGGPYHITAMLTPATALNNYNITNSGADFTINARPATWTTNPASKTYGDSDPAPLTTGSGSNFVAADGVTATYSRAPGETVLAGPYHITATLAPSSVLSNYIITNAGASFTITARLATWTTNPASKTYGDSDPTPLTTGSGSNFVAADGVTATYSRAPGETVLAGPYHITATLAPSSVLSNYIITNAGASFTITARLATWTTNPASKTYGDSDPAPLTTGSGTNFVAADGVTATYSRAPGETVLAGPYHITATLAPSSVLSNYIITNAGASFTITARLATWTTNPASKTYGDSDPTPLTTGSGTNFVAADGVTATYSRAPGETVLAGPYHITATLAPSSVLSNYIITNAGASFTITARLATWTTNPASKTYGDSDPTPLTTGSGTNFVAADGVTATYSRAPGETVLAGPYHITATLAPSSVLSNYIITNAGASFTITARLATWTTNPASKTYGDSDPAPLTTGSGSNFVAADGVTATYSRAPGETVLAGPYHITATLAPSSVLSNYIITNAGASFTITARLATWTTNPASKTYGDSDPTPLTTGSGTNFVAADGVTATYSRAPGETVLAGPYHITATLAPSSVLSNYIITNAGADFTITARLATWTTNPASKTYGDSDPTPLTTGSGTNFVAADGVTATYSRAPGETVLAGPYHITATLAPSSVLSNYIITNAGASFTINARLATWTTNPASKTYGDSDPAPLTTGSGSNFVAADGVTATYSRAPGETVLAGPYHITATLAPSSVLSNYIITNAGASFTITARLATWTTNPASKTYGDSDPTPLTTGSGTNFVAADGVTATYSRAAGEMVLGGPYHITATLSPSAVLSNYVITNAGASFTINPAMAVIASIASSPNPSVYDQTVTFSTTVNNMSNGLLLSEGTVTFVEGSTPICVASILGGTGTCQPTYPGLSIGTHPVSAMYYDSLGNFTSSQTLSNQNFSQVVNARHTSVAITSTEISNFATGSVPIDTTVHLTVTVTDDDAGTPITSTGTFPITSLIASDTFSPSDSTGNGTCVLTGSGASASCMLTVTPVEADLHALTASYLGDSFHLASTQNADMTVTAPLVSQKVCLDAPFNGQAIPAGSTVWFNAVFQTNGQKITKLTHLTFYKQTIQIGSGIPMPVPDGVVTFDPTALVASTTFDPADNRWNTTLPTYNLAGKNWLSGMPVQLPAGLPGSTAPITWCGQFASDLSTISLGWQWAAAVYSSNSNFVLFNPNNSASYDLNPIGVKAVDDNKADVNYQNSDHAGTPENFLKFVIGGARGGGGGNYTGGYSGSGNLK